MMYEKILPLLSLMIVGFSWLIGEPRIIKGYGVESHPYFITHHQRKRQGVSVKFNMGQIKTNDKSSKGGMMDTMNSTEEIKREKGKDDNSLKSWLQTIVVAIVLAMLIKHFLFNTTLVIGPSMEPTLHERDRMVCLVFPLYYSDPKRGDIIILDSPYEKKEYVKRLIGIPGDEIEIREGKVYVNEQPLDESYIEQGLETLPGMESHWVLEKDQYFVLGDNRHQGGSVDSREFGPIPRSSIRSIAKFRYYPFSKIGTL